MATPSSPLACPAGAPGVSVGVDRASKVFANGVWAIEDVTLNVQDGEFVTLIGPSGCGKSTLLRLIAGLSDPSTGRVALGAGAAGTAPRLGFVFQQPTLMPWARVAGNVRLPLDLAGVPRIDAERRVADALAQVGLAEFAEALPRELSGGMQMRVSIARALVTEPQLLLMDEPFGALDEITRNRLDGEILELWRQRRLAALFVTHSIVEAAFLSTRVVVMSARPGRIVADVPVDEPHPRTEAYRLSERFASTALRLSGLLAGAGVGAASSGDR